MKKFKGNWFPVVWSIKPNEWPIISSSQASNITPAICRMNFAVLGFFRGRLLWKQERTRKVLFRMHVQNMKKDVSKTNDFVGGSGIGSSRDGGPSFSFFRISSSFFAKYCFNSFFKFKQSLRGVDIFTTNFFCTSLIEVKFNANLIYVKKNGA